MKRKTTEKVLFFMILLAMCCALVAGPCAIMSCVELMKNGTAQQGTVERVEEAETSDATIPPVEKSENDRHVFMSEYNRNKAMNNLETMKQQSEQRPIECSEPVWETMYISENRVKVYSEPHENANTVTELIFTNKIEACPDTVDEGWTEIKCGEITGYIRDNCMMERQEFLDEFRYLLAQLGTAEASVVGVAEMGRTMEVAIYRMVTTYWEFADQDTLVEVISAYGQYPDSWRKIQNGLEPIPEALAVAEAILTGANETPYLTEEEFQNLPDEEKILLNDYQWQLPRNTYWQTGFNPQYHKWAVEVIARFFCRYKSDGTPYYHYYSIPAGEVPNGNVPLGD